MTKNRTRNEATGLNMIIFGLILAVLGVGFLFLSLPVWAPIVAIIFGLGWAAVGAVLRKRG